MAEIDQQQLPRSISPCPIVDAVADVWFESDLPGEAVFGVIYQALKKEFPNASALPGAMMPAQLKQINPALAHQASYRLEGEKLAVLIGPNNIAVGLRGQYPGWPALKRGLLETLTRVFDLNFIIGVQRFGLRYINFFPYDVLPSLTLSLCLSKDVLLGRETFIKTVLKESGVDTILQISQLATFQNLPGQIGSSIDLDAFQINPKTNDVAAAALSDFLEIAHTSLKSLFFRLLKPEFLATLNPQ